MNRNRKLWRVTCPVCAGPVRARHAEGAAEVLLEVGEHSPARMPVLDATGAPVRCAGGGAWIPPPAAPAPRAPSYEQTRREAPR